MPSIADSPAAAPAAAPAPNIATTPPTSQVFVPPADTGKQTTSPFGGKAAPAYQSTDPRALRREAAGEKDEFEDAFTDTKPAAKPVGDKDPRAAEPADKPEDEDKSVDFPAPPVENKEELGTEQRVTLPGERRDYSNVDPELVPLFKGLHNNQYAKFGEKIKDWHSKAKQTADLQAKLDAVHKENPRYLAEHPQAFTLAPQYQEAVGTYRDAMNEEQHWTEQLLKIKNGDDWDEWTGYDQQGAPIVVKHKAPENGRVDMAAEIKVSQVLNNTSNARQRAQQAAQHIAQTYGQFQQDSHAELERAYKAFFPQMDYKTLQGPDKKYFDNILQVIPPAFRDSPLAPALGLAHVSVRNIAMYAKGLEEQVAELKAGRLPAAVGPRNTGAARMGNGIVDLEEMFSDKDE